MTVEPHIRSIARPTEDEATLDIAITVPSDLHYLEGHFPEFPLLPGVVQLTWAIDFARRHLDVCGEFRGVAGLKFMRVIQPNTPVGLQLRFDRRKGALEFEYRNDAGVCARGTVLFAA